MRVKNPDNDYWGELNQVLKYLKGTKHMKMNLTVDSTLMINWFVYES